MAHIAFWCQDVAELKALRQQVKGAGVTVTPILDHGMCYSAYFQDPNGFQLELCTTVRPYVEDVGRQTWSHDLTAPLHHKSSKKQMSTSQGFWTDPCKYRMARTNSR